MSERRPRREQSGSTRVGPGLPWSSEQCWPSSACPEASRGCSRGARGVATPALRFLSCGSRFPSRSSPLACSASCSLLLPRFRPDARRYSEMERRVSSAAATRPRTDENVYLFVPNLIGESDGRHEIVTTNTRRGLRSGNAQRARRESGRGSIMTEATPPPPVRSDSLTTARERPYSRQTTSEHHH